jgi:hypothetical protein
MSAHALPPLAVNSKSERKVNSLPLLGFELVIFGMLAHLSDHSAKSHPMNIYVYMYYYLIFNDENKNIAFRSMDYQLQNVSLPL